MKSLIVNADDFGASRGINRGIRDCHLDGVVTSTSLTVTGRAAREAAELSRDLPALSVGLHWDVWGEDEREFPLSNHAAVRDEIAQQLDDFYQLLGRMPTHIHSHRHVHRREDLMPLFLETLAPLHIPLRGGGAVRYVGLRFLPPRQAEVGCFVADVTAMESLLGLTPPDDPLSELSSLWDPQRELALASHSR